MQFNIFLLSVLVNHYAVESSPHTANTQSTATTCQHNCQQHTRTPKRDQDFALNVIQQSKITNKSTIKYIDVPTKIEQGQAAGQKRIPRKCKNTCIKNRHTQQNRTIELHNKTMEGLVFPKCHYNCCTNGQFKKEKMFRRSHKSPRKPSSIICNSVHEFPNNRENHHIRMKTRSLANETTNHKKKTSRVVKLMKVQKNKKTNHTSTNLNMFQKHAVKNKHIEQKRRFSIPVPLPLLLSKVSSIASLFKNDTSANNIETQQRGEKNRNGARINSNFNWGKLMQIQNTEGQTNVRSNNLGDRFSSFIPGVKKDVMTNSENSQPQYKVNFQDKITRAHPQPKEYSKNMNDVTTPSISNLGLSRTLNDIKTMPEYAQPVKINQVTTNTEGNTPQQPQSSNINDEDKSLTNSIEAVKKDAMAEVGAISEADVSSLFMNPWNALHKAFSKIATKALPRTLKVIGDIADVLKSISRQEPKSILKKANLLYRRGRIPKHPKASHKG